MLRDKMKALRNFQERNTWSVYKNKVLPASCAKSYFKLVHKSLPENLRRKKSGLVGVDRRRNKSPRLACCPLLFVTNRNAELLRKSRRGLNQNVSTKNLSILTWEIIANRAVLDCICSYERSSRPLIRCCQVLFSISSTQSTRIRYYMNLPAFLPKTVHNVKYSSENLECIKEWRLIRIGVPLMASMFLRWLYTSTF